MAETPAPKPIRVLLVGPTMDTFPGGIAVQASRLATDLRGTGRIEVSKVPITPQAPSLLRPLQRVPYVRTVLTSALYLWRLVRAIPKCDVIHINSARFSSFLISSVPAMALARVFRRKAVLNYHNGNLRTELERFGWVFRWLLRWPTEIVVPSQFLSEVLRAKGISSRIIANHVDLDRFPYRERRPVRPIFLSCRHFEPIYDVPTLIHGFAKIQAARPDAALLIAGRGSMEGDIRALVNRLGLQQVQFLGQQAPDQMPFAYGAADILLNTSRVDNMPVTVIEAFASGLPVLTTDAGGIPFMVEDGVTGSIIPTGDPEALAQRALALLADPEGTAQMAERARTVVETRYSWEKVRNCWVSLYESLARPPQPDLRILLVGPTLDTFPGGIAVQAARLASGMNKIPGVRLDQQGITPQAPRPLRGLQRLPGVRTIVTTSLLVGTLFRKVRRYDVVHVNSARFSSFVISSLPAILVAKLWRKPVVLNYRHGNLHEELDRIGWLFRPMLRLADALAVPSRFLWTVMDKAGLQATIIANQVDLGRFRYRERLPLRPIFLSCRHFEDLYDVPTLIRAFGRIQQVRPEAQLVVAGKGTREAEVRALVKELGLDHVQFIGQISPEDMPKVFDSVDILLNSSRIDNTPGTIVEAFAAGLPVVSTNPGGIPFLVDAGVTGQLVEVGDDGALARAALDLLDNPPAASAMAARAHEHASGNFSWQAVQDKWLTLYRGVLSRGAAAVPERRPA